MKLYDLISRKSWIIIATVVLIILIYYILKFYIFDSNPQIDLVSSAINSYLILIEDFSDILLRWFGSAAVVSDHLISFNNESFFEIDSGILMKKWIIILLFVFWFTKTSIKQKILFTFLLFISNFLGSLTTIFGIAMLSEFNFERDSAYFIARTLGILLMIFIFHIWIRKNKDFYLEKFSKLKLNTDLINSKIPSIFIVLYIYAFAGNFILGYFNFGIWIDLLFKSAQKILSLIGSEAIVEPNYLIGSNGTIYMARACLGFKTILLFASIVFLTGNNNIKRWSFIIAGVVLLNIVNIVRFVLLFLHVQKYGYYHLKMDVHDMYTYITYSIVFILWVIWFEFFTDIKNITIKTEKS